MRGEGARYHYRRSVIEGARESVGAIHQAISELTQINPRLSAQTRRPLEAKAAEYQVMAESASRLSRASYEDTEEGDVRPGVMERFQIDFARLTNPTVKLCSGTPSPKT